ncbi:MAG: 50S ribosomal protein L11 methyltransferase [Pseudomonadota bacterium]
MSVYSALTTLPGEEAAAALGEALEAALGPSGLGVFEIEDGSGLWEVGGYFDAPPDAGKLALLAAAYGAAEFAVSKIEDRDWVAQVRRELTPVRVGPFVVHGRHDRNAVGANALSLEIEAAMAFGTGHHGTTAGCLEALLWASRRGYRLRRVADVGCGTGVLAMGAARLGPGAGALSAIGRGGPAAVLASDIDPVAAATARANIAANPRRAPVAALQATGFRHARLRAAAPFDLLFMNILARPLRLLAPEAALALRAGGLAVLSGLLPAQAPSVLATYRGHGFAARHRIERQGWATLILRRGRR